MQWQQFLDMEHTDSRLQIVTTYYAFEKGRGLNLSQTRCLGYLQQ